MFTAYLVVLTCALSFPSWVTGKIQNKSSVSLNRNKNIGFISNNYCNSYTFELGGRRPLLNKINYTPKIKVRPSTLYSQPRGRSDADGEEYFGKNSYKFKKTISPLDANVTFLDSAISFWAYVIPLMKCSENFEQLLLTLNLPEFINKIIFKMLKVKTFISSIPNLMDVIILAINKMFLVENRLNPSHFIRFNFTQGNILYMYVNLLSLFYIDFITPLGDSLLPTFIGYTLMFSSIAPLFYCMSCSLLGKYSQLPIVSQAAEMTVNSRRVDKKVIT